MAPSSACVSAQLKQMIVSHLDNNLNDNALFLAGRLHAIDAANFDSVHLLALCHLRLGQNQAAYHVAKLTAMRGAHLGCSYVFAQACLARGIADEGVLALDRTKASWAMRPLATFKCESGVRRFFPDAAAVYCLLGKLCRKNLEEKRATECFTEALKLNPFMWDAFEMICDSNVSIRPPSIFKSNADLLAFLSTNDTQRRANEDTTAAKIPAPQNPSQQTSSFASTPMSAYDPFNARPAEETYSGLRINASSRLNIGASTANTAMSAWPDTPPSVPPSEDYPGASTASTSNAVPGLEPPAAPLRKTRSIHVADGEPPIVVADAPKLPFGGPSRARSVKSASESTDDSEPRKSTVQGGSMQQKRTISGNLHSHLHPSAAEFSHLGAAAPQRRSNRLLQKDPESMIPSAPLVRDARGELRKMRATGTRGRAANASTVGRIVSGNRKAAEPLDPNLKQVPRSTSSSTGSNASTARHLAPDTTERDSLNAMLDMFNKIGLGYYALSKYNCSAALTHFASLPTAQRETPWVLIQMGKAYYEQNDYSRAEAMFAGARRLDPTRLQDMEVYSTVLWHLKLDTMSVLLSLELSGVERLCPQTWVSVGNTYALQRDHDLALKCFKRATQLDPRFAYGYTLQGHEYFENEEYEQAKEAFRRAITHDRRQYNAWYGLGKVYDKQGQMDQAERHFKIASQINPNNSVIVVGIGMALEKLRKSQQALSYYERAVELAPQSKLARFKKARLLVQMKEYEMALQELETLKNMVPDEPNVHFLLGRIHKRLGDKSSALRHYTMAMNLDPKVNPTHDSDGEEYADIPIWEPQAAGLVKEAMEELDEDDNDEDYMDIDDEGGDEEEDVENDEY